MPMAYAVPVLMLVVELGRLPLPEEIPRANRSGPATQ